MASWRDNASVQAQHDLDGLLEPALGFAQRQLSEHGDFYPYMVVVGVDGEIEMVAARPDVTDDAPTSNDVLEACRATLVQRRGELRATAVVADVRLPDGGDAIRVELEHADGLALTVVLPYARSNGAARDVAYGAIRATAGTRYVWTS